MCILMMLQRKMLQRMCDTKWEDDLTVHFRFHPLNSHYRQSCTAEDAVFSGSLVVWKGAIKPLEGILIYSEQRKDKIVNEEFKVSCKPQIRKAEVKCRHRLPAAKTTSPFSPALPCWLGRYVGSQHQFATVTQPNGSEHWRPPLKWIRSITVCRGEEPSSTA